MSAHAAERRPVFALAALAAVGLIAAGWWWSHSGPEEPAPHAPAPAPAVAASEPEPELLAPAALAGIVTDRDTLQGIAGALVNLSCPDGVSGSRETDSDGRFAWQDPPVVGLTCEVSASAVGHVAGGPGAGRPARVVFSADGEAADVRLELSRAARVTGRVLDGGRPVEDATLTVLYLEAEREPEPWSETSDDPTDATGAFSLARLVPGRLQILAEHEEYGLAESEPFFLHPGELRQGLIISLSAAAAVRVSVRDPAGAPVLGAMVRLVLPGMTQPVIRRADEAGAVVFEPVSPGEALVSVDAKGFEPVRRRAVQVTAGEDVDVDLVLQRRGGFGGIVLAPDGNPVPRASVHLVGAGDTHVGHGAVIARSDRYGRFWIESVDTFPTQVVASHPDWRQSDVVRVLADGADVELRLREGGRVVGRVVDGSGRPVHAFRINLLLEQAARYRGGGSAQVQRLGDGRFEIPSVAPGVYVVRASGTGLLPASVEGVEVTAGEVTDVGDLVLEGGGAAVGRLVDAETGDPLRGAVRVTFSGYGRGAEGASARAGEDGVFRLEGLWPQRMSVNAMSPGYTTRMVSGVDPRPGQVVDLGDIALTARTGGRGQMQYTGVGAQLRMTGEGIELTRIFDGSPAMEAGLQPGSIIVGINGQDAADYDLRRAVEIIRGEVGTEVDLEIIPPDGGHPQHITVERREVTTS